MKPTNYVVVEGYLSREPVLLTTVNHRPACRLHVELTAGRGEIQDVFSVEAVAFGDTVAGAEQLQKGDAVHVMGHLRPLRQLESAPDGAVASRLAVVAHTVKPAEDLGQGQRNMRSATK